MIWLRAAWNCLKRGIKALVISIGITLGILAAAFGVVCLVSLIGCGIELLVGEGFWHNVGAWFEHWGPWMLGGLVLVMLGIVAWDSLSAEKAKLERRENEQVPSAD